MSRCDLRTGTGVIMTATAIRQKRQALRRIDTRLDEVTGWEANQSLGLRPSCGLPAVAALAVGGAEPCARGRVGDGRLCHRQCAAPLTRTIPGLTLGFVTIDEKASTVWLLHFTL